MKHIRVAIQRLVVILPQEEQNNIRPITQEETKAAFNEEGDHEDRVLKVVNKSVKSVFISKMLKYRSEFVEEYQVWLCRFDYIIMNHGGQDMICGMCEQCR